MLIWQICQVKGKFHCDNDHLGNEQKKFVKRYRAKICYILWFFVCFLLGRLRILYMNFNLKQS